MNYLDILILILKYIPFWAVPMGMMSANFGYNYWLKDFKEMSYGWFTIAFFCLTSTVIYFAIGGPDQIIQNFTHVYK